MKFGPDGYTDEQRDIIRKLDNIANRLEKTTTTKREYLLRAENPNDDGKPAYMAHVFVDENNEWRLRGLIAGMKDHMGYGISMEEVSK